MINGGKIFLKLMRIEDIPEVCKILESNNAKMISYSFGDELDVESREKSLINILESNANDRFHFLIFSSKSKKIIGYIFVTNINWIKSSAEVTVIVSDKYLSTGYGYIAIAALISYCFSELNLEKIYSQVRSDNYNIGDRIEGQLIRRVPSEKNKFGEVTYIDYYYREWIKREWTEDESVKKFCDLMNIDMIL